MEYSKWTLTLANAAQTSENIAKLENTASHLNSKKVDLEKLNDSSNSFFHNLSLSHIYAATILKDHFN
jgi:hypothetical protein